MPSPEIYFSVLMNQRRGWGINIPFLFLIICFMLKHLMTTVNSIEPDNAWPGHPKDTVIVQVGRDIAGRILARLPIQIVFVVGAKIRLEIIRLWPVFDESPGGDTQPGLSIFILEYIIYMMVRNAVRVIGVVYIVFKYFILNIKNG